MTRSHTKAGELANNGSLFKASLDENISVAANVDAAVAAQAGLCLVGYSCREKLSAVAAFNIIHGATGATGTQAVNVRLTGDGTETKYLGESGIDCPDGISIERLAGTFDVTIHYKVL